MLKIQPAQDETSAGGPTIALGLAGGGPVGGIYELGVLLALDEALEGLDLNNLDIYVGVSSGSFVASMLINQVSTEEMYGIFVRNDSIEHLFSPETFLQPAFMEYFSRAISIPELFIHAFEQYVKHPDDLGLLESMSSLGRALPTGFFNNEKINIFLEHVFNYPGRSNDFRELAHKLLVVAVDLNTSESVIFGDDGYDHVPVSKAVQASSALPGLYPPVAIDGHYYVDGALRKTLHASAALDAGANLVLCINPLVPFDANFAVDEHGNPKPGVHNLVNGGLPVVLSQTFRTIIHSRMQVGMANYKSQYPQADIVLFEPNLDDAKMFFTNVFSFSNRHRVCEHAYQATRKELYDHRHKLKPVLARHGFELRLDVLEDDTRCVSTGLRGGMVRDLDLCALFQESHGVLDELERWAKARAAHQKAV
ncbi:MAG: patatin-like phospholipase family protein [Candidatus Competibacteraceae bacterium]|nr:patatin-like phospholipase family protein [Candidatus Competibacteraceae bacterium]